MKNKLIILIIVLIIFYRLYKTNYLQFITKLFSLKESFKLPHQTQLEDIENKIALNAPQMSNDEVIVINELIQSIITKQQFIHIQTPKLDSFNKLPINNHKHILLFLKDLFKNIHVCSYDVSIKVEHLDNNIFFSINDNYLFLTPLEITGKFFIDKKLAGDITLKIILRGKTNSLFIPQNGFFINDIKFSPIIDNIFVIHFDKPNYTDDTHIGSTRGFYAVADTINYSINQPHNPPLVSFNDIQNNFNDIQNNFNDDTDINLSEIIQEQPNEFQQVSDQQNDIEY